MNNLQTYFSNLLIWNVKLHNYHWNVVGKQFMSVHTFTEEVYDNVFEQYDTVAELLKMRGQTPLVTVKDYLAHASIEEVSAKDFGVEEVLKAVHSEMTLMKDLAYSIRNEADEKNDATIVTTFEDFITYGSEAKCREAGKLNVEGKTYIVKDGDIMHFLFNV